LIFLPSTISCEDGEEKRLLLESSQRKERNCSEQAAAVQRAAAEVTGDQSIFFYKTDDQSMAVFPIQNGSSNNYEGRSKEASCKASNEASNKHLLRKEGGSFLQLQGSNEASSSSCQLWAFFWLGFKAHL
jgi:hypothetical protein